MTDDMGAFPAWATKVIIGSAVILAAAALTVATAGTGTALACFAVGALKGAVSGALIGAASGAATGAVSHRIKTGSWNGAGQAAIEGAADGYMSGAVTGFVTGGLNSNACFIAGTAVLTSVGYVAIEEIKSGDFVFAENPETGDVSLKKVVQTYVNESYELLHITVGNEVITSTNTHPFYVRDRGWISACDLKAGDILVSVNGEYLIVQKVQHEYFENPIFVYNFEVEDYHTYFVGCNSVLVHNSCNHNSKWASERRRYWKSQAKTVKPDVNYGSYVATDKNINRMSLGKAPKGWDGKSVELHHWKGIKNDFYDYSPVSRTLHQSIHSLRRSRWKL